MLEDQRTSKYVLVIDLGTSGPKVGLVDQQGQVTCSASAPVQVSFPPMAAQNTTRLSGGRPSPPV